MSDEAEHAAAVGAWLARTSALPSERMIQAFELAFAALWRRAHHTLGEVTLGAIVDRVLHVASEHYPPFAVLALPHEVEVGTDVHAFEKAAGPGPLDLSTVLRRGRLAPVAGSDHRPSSFEGADTRRAAGCAGA
jgi:hypothetical protein